MKRRKIVRRIKEARAFNRPGFWFCVYCSAHNTNEELHCRICSCLRRNVKKKEPEK